MDKTNKILLAVAFALVLLLLVLVTFMSGYTLGSKKVKVKVVKQVEYVDTNIFRMADSIYKVTKNRQVAYTSACCFYRYQTEKIPAKVLYAVASMESNFRPEVVSVAGAVGLMQVKKSTALWLKKTFKLTKEVDLKDIDSNVYYASKYLNFLYEHFEKQGVDKSVIYIYVLIAYNEGQNSKVLKKSSLKELTEHKYYKGVLKKFSKTTFIL